MTGNPGVDAQRQAGEITLPKNEMSENTHHLQWYERFGGEKKKIPDAGVTPGCQPLSHVLNSGFEQEMDRSAFAATKRHNPDKKRPTTAA